MKKGLTLSGKRSITGMLFILPFAIGFTFFIGVSILTTVRMSLSDVTAGGAGVGVSMVWNDFANYITAFSAHPSFKQELTSSIGYMIIDVPLIIFFSLFMAMLLNQKFRGRTVVRAIFFLPVILGAAAIRIAIGEAQTMMVGGVSAASAEVMNALGSTNTNVNVSYYLHMMGELGLPSAVIGYVVNAVHRINNVITSSGVQIIIFVAALQSIPPSLYEVSKIEGATAYETFWKVTFPMVSPLILTNVVYTIIDQFANSSVVALSYNTIFSEYNYGLGSVFSLVSSLLVCMILLAIGLLLNRRTHYST